MPPARSVGSMVLPFPILDNYRVYFKASDCHDVVRWLSCRTKGRAITLGRKLNAVAILSNKQEVIEMR